MQSSHYRETKAGEKYYRVVFRQTQHPERWAFNLDVPGFSEKEARELALSIVPNRNAYEIHEIREGLK